MFFLESYRYVLQCFQRHACSKGNLKRLDAFKAIDLQIFFICCLLNSGRKTNMVFSL